MARTRCSARECGRFAVAGHLVCSRHMAHPALIEPPAQPSPADRYAAKLAAAESYRDLIGPKLSRLMREAAEEQSLTDEIGMLRIAMTRVMSEEHDPARLASAVSRLATAAVHTMRAQRAIDGTLADSLTDALTTILLELDAAENAR